MTNNNQTEPTTTKVYEALNWASSLLAANQYEHEIATRLLQHHTGWTRTHLLTELQSTLPANTWTQYQHDIQQAANSTPVQHITGQEQFYGRTYHINKHVLIPRPETEELVQALLTRLQPFFGKNRPSLLNLVDVGTGSGIIAITLALELASRRVFATDISATALAVAKKNATNLEANIHFFQGDLLTPLIEQAEKVSIVISNPPYIPYRDREQMKENVKNHEPAQALFAGEDGLTIYRRLIKQIPDVLLRPGIIAFEIGHGQGGAVQTLIHEEFPEAEIEIINDINKNERIVIAEIQ